MKRRYLLLPYSAERIRQMHLVTGYLGGWTFLSDKEFHDLKMNCLDNIHDKLESSGILLSPESLTETISRYQRINRNLFMGPSLHMINVTNTCNNRCSYCHAGVSMGKDRMDEITARKVVDFIFSCSGENITIEFQGGECLMNWKVVRLVTETARKRTKRGLKIAAVSNLLLLDDEKLEFLMSHDVDICTSLDGPKGLHDNNRRTVGGSGTFDETVKKITHINSVYKKKGIQKQVWCLATITRESFRYPQQIIDTYLGLGIPLVHLRQLNDLGDAEGKTGLGYSAEEFIAFWKECMEYLLMLNIRGRTVIERGAANLLCRILGKEDPLYVELMSPTGMGRGCLLYNYDGSIYSSDEGRMLNSDVFRIGDVSQVPGEVIGSEENISTWSSSCMELYSYFSPYRPFLGIHPVKVYKEQGTVIPSIMSSSQFRILESQCRYLFERLDRHMKIFGDWIRPIVKGYDFSAFDKSNKLF